MLFYGIHGFLLVLRKQVQKKAGKFPDSSFWPFGWKYCPQVGGRRCCDESVFQYPLHQGQESRPQLRRVLDPRETASGQGARAGRSRPVLVASHLPTPVGELCGCTIKVTSSRYHFSFLKL